MESIVRANRLHSHHLDVGQKLVIPKIPKKDN